MRLCLLGSGSNGNALLLEHVVAFNHAAAPARYAAIATACGLDVAGLPAEAQKARLVEALHDLRLAAGLTRSLRERGVRPADIARLAHNAHKDPCLATNPVQPTVDQIAEVFERGLDA